MLPLVKGLAGQGIRVFAAFRNLANAVTVFKDAGVTLLAAPFNSDGRRWFPPSRAASVAHLLANTGFGSNAELIGLASAWRNLFRLIKPDLIVFDHSPIALLASRGLPLRRIIIGTGFFTPPNAWALPIIKTPRSSPIMPSTLAADEERIIVRVIWALSHWKQPPVGKLADIYHDGIDQHFFTTFHELDHFPARTPTPRYWGPVNGSGGKKPEWPEAGDHAGGRRFFAYLKPFPGLETLLSVLCDRAQPALIYAPDIGSKTRSQFDCPALRFESQRMDPSLLARQCNAAILHGTHGTLCDVLLAGKAVLNIPLSGEQQLLSERVCELGAGVMLSAQVKDRAAIENVLDQVLGEAGYRVAAESFAKVHADFDPIEQRRLMLERTLEVLSLR